MQQKDSKFDFTGQDIYVGLDIGKKDWKVNIHTKEMELKAFSQSPKPEVLVRYLRIFLDSRGV
jgi:hypothetical protein